MAAGADVQLSIRGPAAESGASVVRSGEAPDGRQREGDRSEQLSHGGPGRCRGGRSFSF